MPQLTNKNGRPSESGSVLITIVALITLMTIAMGGFLGVARNMVNQEYLEWNDDKAYLAAESGLLIGTRWLRNGNNWNQYKNTGYPGAVHSGTVNGFSVTVYVTLVQNGDLRISSTASGNGLPYVKRLSWSVHENQWSKPGIFINNISQSGDVGGGGLNNEWFDGPMHTNTPIKVSSVGNGQVSVKFVNGDVSVHNSMAQISFDHGGNWGNYGTSPVSGNNYDFGIWHHDANAGDYGKIDLFFERNGSYRSFKHSADSLFMPRLTTQTRTLPLNRSQSSRAILYFDVQNGTTGRATYYYTDASNNQQSVVFNSDREIIRIQNDVSVLGTVKGQTTVVTDSGFTIYPVGDLTYYGFQPNDNDMSVYSNTNDYGLGSYSEQNNYVLALVSGGDISFGLDKNQLSLQNGVASLSPIDVHGNNTPTMYVTGQLLATEHDRGIRWASTQVNEYNYKLRALGTRAIDLYEESHNAEGGPGNDAFRFYYDTRFNDGLQAPGVSYLRATNQSEELFILNTDWSEENSLSIN